MAASGAGAAEATSADWGAAPSAAPAAARGSANAALPQERLMTAATVAGTAWRNVMIGMKKKRKSGGGHSGGAGLHSAPIAAPRHTFFAAAAPIYAIFL